MRTVFILFLFYICKATSIYSITSLNISDNIINNLDNNLINNTINNNASVLSNVFILFIGGRYIILIASGGHNPISIKPIIPRASMLK